MDHGLNVQWEDTKMENWVVKIFIGLKWYGIHNCGGVRALSCVLSVY